MKDAQLFSRPLHALSLGESFETQGRTITETDVVGFAALTGDTHPLHLDAEWASSSRFGERIAHGMLLVSYAMGLLPLDPDYVLALRALRDVVFKRPVAIGSTILVRGELVAIRNVDPAVGLAVIRMRIGEREGPPACLLSVEALWRAEQGASDAGG